MTLKCLIVDDEPLSLDVLEKYINDIPELELAGRCFDAFDAMKKLKELGIMQKSMLMRISSDFLMSCST